MEVTASMVKDLREQTGAGMTAVSQTTRAEQLISRTQL